jgi:hypothetical protein
MKLAASSDNLLNQPTVTHTALNRLQVCVPSHWTILQTLNFAESKWHSISRHHWAPTPADSPQDCDLQTGFVHINLEAQPNLKASTTDSPPVEIEASTIHARVIINLDNTKAQNIFHTAESIQLLVEYLYLKAAAAKAVEENQLDEAQKHEVLAENLNSRLLAQFTGTLVFV